MDSVGALYIERLSIYCVLELVINFKRMGRMASKKRKAGVDPRRAFPRMNKGTGRDLAKEWGEIGDA